MIFGLLFVLSSTSLESVMNRCFTLRCNVIYYIPFSIYIHTILLMVTRFTVVFGALGRFSLLPFLTFLLRFSLTLVVFTGLHVESLGNCRLEMQVYGFSWFLTNFHIARSHDRCKPKRTLYIICLHVVQPICVHASWHSK